MANRQYNQMREQDGELYRLDYVRVYEGGGYVEGFVVREPDQLGFMVVAIELRVDGAGRYEINSVWRQFHADDVHIADFEASWPECAELDDE